MIPTKLNIAFILPAEVTVEAIALSSLIDRQADTDFVLNNVNYIPHISLYWSEFQDDISNKVVEELTAIKSQLKKLKLKFKELESDLGYIALEFERNERIFNMHKLVLEKINPLRQGHLRKKYMDNEFLNNLPEEDRYNILTYGYRHAMGLYHPHITVTKLSDENEAKEIVGNTYIEFQDIELGSIGVFYVGKHGICKKLIHKIDL